MLRSNAGLNPSFLHRRVGLRGAGVTDSLLLKFSIPSRKCEGLLTIQQLNQRFTRALLPGSVKPADNRTMLIDRDRSAHVLVELSAPHCHN